MKIQSLIRRAAKKIGRFEPKRKAGTPPPSHHQIGREPSPFYKKKKKTKKKF